LPNNILETQRKVFSVSQLTRNIRFVLEGEFASVWVEGEISNFLHHGSGHMYLSLKDAAATLQCAMFRQDNRRLVFKPQSGMNVICHGRISIYPQRGQYQLIIDAIEPKGVGSLQIAFEQLKAKLSKEGLFDPARKRPLPFLPHCLGIITSPTGAVIHDMLRVLERRFPGASILVYPSQVQGPTAKSSLVQAINDMNKDARADVLVLARGGGSLEDLWPFNEEIVARAIAASRIPVVSAVGHEVDFTIADFVADLRAPTPSAAAEVVFPLKEDLLLQVEELRKRIVKAVRDLPLLWQEELDDINKRLESRVGSILELFTQKMMTLVGKLDVLSPLGSLVRGYSITFDQKTSKILKSVKEIKSGSRVKTRLSDGEFTSIVE
jgi:exodeoxyribonuclease VII large subunit